MYLKIPVLNCILYKNIINQKALKKYVFRMKSIKIGIDE